MPRKKSLIFHALKPSHLQAIGRVAAEWSKLEMVFQFKIAEVAGIDPIKTLILTKSGNIGTWMKMLRNMISHVYPNDTNVQDDLEKLCKTINNLQNDRNTIVHSVWTPQTIQTGLRAGMFGSALDPAAGLKLPKRGKHIITNIIKTAAEMRKIAKAIESATSELIQITSEAQQRALRRITLAKTLKQLPPHQPPNPGKP